MKLGDAIKCARSDVRHATSRFLRRRLGRSVPSPLPSHVPIRKIKNKILSEGLAVDNGAVTWFYIAYDRGDGDPLTNFSLKYLVERFPKDAKVLVTGCGTGIMAFYLADKGLRNVSGFDLFPECIRVANWVKEEGGYTESDFFVADGFKPELSKQYDVITALHWVFSAWMGNYGNDSPDAERAYDPDFREQRLDELLGHYSPHLKPGGEILFEITDAVADYRLPEDHPHGEASKRIYPIRLTPEQVARCAERQGLEVVDKKLGISWGHHPRTLHILGKPKS